jgi:purine-nucleoside/S-methyl-5'-thioadenosine phosphorylase / adenosine deaminase
MSLATATVPLLAAVPGLVHGFERRDGAPSFAETREETRARVGEALRPLGRLLLLRQVHGARVARAPWDAPPEADAAVVAGGDFILGIETADCLPVLVVDPRRRAAAVAHAGWRGTAEGVATRAVEALRAEGSRAEDLVAALGPCIGACCYEVGEAVRDAFGAGVDPLFRPGPAGRPHFDLRAANARQLASAGLRPEAIAHIDECTRCLPGRYHSYRRDGKGAGRMISYVGFGR